MLKKKSNFVILAMIAAMFAMTSSVAKSQESVSFQNKLKSILNNFNNFRFSSVDFYEINDKQVRSLKEIIKKRMDFEEEEEKPEAVNQDVMDPERLNMLVDEIKKLMASGERTLPGIRRAFNGEKDGYEYLEDLEVNDVELRLAFQQAQGNRGPKTDIYKMFLVTTPVKDVSNPPDIISLVLCKQRVDKEEYEEYLIAYYNQVIGNSISNEKNVLTYPELMNFIIEDDADQTKTTNLYDKLIVEFRQGNCQLITPEVRGIGGEISFVKTYGKTTSMISNENDITSADISKFIRISDGQPTDYIKDNEIIISPDLISYKKYNTQYYEYEDEEGKIQMMPYSNANSNLPSYGAEVRYGIDEVNYPSFWSERMSIRAIWDNVKCGFILPTSGWASLSKDLFDVDRSMTHAGFGVTFNADFPIKVIPQSGVFSLGASYVFGDAKEATYKDRGKLRESDEYQYVKNNLLYNDYLVRFTGQLHYTFGINIDEDYMLRFGIGGTVLGVETWRDDKIHNENVEDSWGFIKDASETIGGVSMKAEFMARNVTTPYGATLQYFDESISGGIWIQIPIVENVFFLRLDAKGYAAAFKDEPRIWEKRSLFMPMARLVFNF